MDINYYMCVLHVTSLPLLTGLFSLTEGCGWGWGVGTGRHVIIYVQLKFYKNLCK